MAIERERIPTIATVAGDPAAWGWTLASGIVLVLAGVLALIAPTATTVYLAIFLAWVLVIAGAAGIVMGLRTRDPQRRWFDLLYGAASLVLGIVLLARPLAGALSLTLAFVLWLAVRGLIELIGAGRAQNRGLRTGLVVAGLVNLLLAALLFFNFPYPAVQVIGLFVGISFLFAGMLTLAAAFQLRRLAHS